MAHDPNATKLIASMKASVKLLEAEQNEYYQKFIVQKAVPTKHDVEELTKLVAKIHQVAQLMHSDLGEVNKAIMTFGGPSDTALRGADTLLRTVKSKLPK